jgi:peptidoglycan-associated lipoprotein
MQLSWFLGVVLFLKKSIRSYAMNVFIKSAAIVLSVVMLWGCTSTPKTTAEAGGAASVGAAPQAAGPTTGTVGTGAVDTGSRMVEGDEPSDPNSPLAKHIVYFDFDKNDIKLEARQIIERHAKYLAANPNTRIVLQGHCDERGTREYNLSLGERRSRAVQQVMTLLGVSANQLELVSYGEERPAAAGHDESALALNRRVELVY